MNSTAIRLQKAALRKELRRLAAGHTAAERAAASEQIRQQLRAQPQWQQARAVLGFVPMPEEPDIWPLVTEALAAGKRVALPRYDPANDRYWAHEVKDCLVEVGPGYHGIGEPLASCARFDLKALDFIMAPGLGFARNGSRLGRGKGYYDDLLRGASGWKCGVAFDWQIVAEIPTDGRDVFLDCIMTPSAGSQVGVPPPVVK
jgi:5-formyltetrahydrofolate cyclo-ligase